MPSLARLAHALLIAALALATAPATAAADEAGLPLLRTYDSAGNGSSVQNWAIVQDGRGVMYFGSTDDGVLEFDGIHWRSIPTPNRTTIRSLVLGADGRVYVGATGEIGVLTPDASGQMQYVSLLDRVPEAERDFADVWSAFADGRGIYFTTFKRIIRIEGERTQVWNAKGAFHIGYMARGRLYIREVGRGLMQMVDGELQPLPQGEEFANEKVAAVLPWPIGSASNGQADSTGQALLIGTRTKGWFVLEHGQLRPWRTQVDAELASAQLYNVIRLADGRLAAATLLGGVFLLDADGRLAGRIDKSTGLSVPTVYNLRQDRQGGLWLALDKGVARVEIASPLTHFSALNGVEGSVIRMHRHEGVLYAGSTQGLFRLQTEPGRPARFVPVPGINGHTWAFLSLGDVLLVGGMRGVHELRQGQWRLLLPSSTTVVTLQRSRRNPQRVFVGKIDGLLTLRAQGTAWVQEGPVAGVPDEVRSIVQEDDGRIWLGTMATGVVMLPPEFDRAEGPPDMQAAQRARRFGAAHGLPGGTVFIYSVEGRPVFAASRGVYRFDAARGVIDADPRFAQVFKDGVRQVYPLVEDGRGGVWMFSQDSSRATKEAGVARRLEGRSGYRFDARPLAELEGMAQADILPEEPDAVWIAGDEGIFRLDRRAPAAADPPFQALVTKVSGRDGRLHFGGAGVRDALPIDYAHNTLRFEFAAATFGRQPLRFQTLLQGVDRNWNAATRETYLDYTNLREGEYRFRVRAIDAFGRVSQEGSWAFQIQPPWYRTLPAYVAYVLAAGLALYGLATWRSAALRARNRHLAQLVATQTRELSSANEALQSANAALAELSLTDTLTGLKNRRYLGERISEDMAVLRRSHAQAALWAGGEPPQDEAQLLFIMIDIDHFKQINDQYGHAAGDRVLEQFGTILRSVCRDTDTAVRWGGEEFLLVARQTSAQAGMALAERIRTQVAAHAFVLDDGRTLRRSCSLGFAGFPLQAGGSGLSDWEVSVNFADQCLYEAKRGGRNAWVGVRPTGKPLPAHEIPATDLDAAIAQGWLQRLHMPELAPAAASVGGGK